MRSSAAAVSARVETLILRHHDGDHSVAARRIGIEQERLMGLLSGNWELFSLDAIAAVVDRHPVSVAWLLGMTNLDEARARVPSAHA
jgi:hypothetical protein